MADKDKKQLLHFVKNLPHRPGVYRMLDKKGVVLYVGKAKDLRARVASYFTSRNHAPRTLLMLSQVNKIETTVTHNEVEALILENNLIKSLHPKYNIIFRDDKSYPFIKISSEKFPRISYYRGPLKKPDHYFGPYTNTHYVRASISFIQKTFRIRICENSIFRNRIRPCLLYQIKRCSAPCTGETSEENYQTNVKEAMIFLEGKTNSLIEQLTLKMNEASEKLNFEQAARYRDQIVSLNQTQKNQFINSQDNPELNLDILAVVSAQSLVAIQWISIRNGQYVGDKSFLKNRSELPEGGLQEYTDNFLAQHYLGREKPDTIISNFFIPEVLQRALIFDSSRKIQFSQNVIGERKHWLKMAEENALLAIQQKELSTGQQKTRLKRLQEVLHLNLDRIECFDISHTFGEATVGSCVVYENGAMQPSSYRRYNMRQVTCGDDYLAMEETLTRRYKNQPENYPDLVLIDGGKGQISVALKVWQSLGLTIPIVGVAKGPTRKPGLEELIIPAEHKTIRLEESDPALLLIQTIRDEAHRFAITGHRKRRAHNRKKSELDAIPLIGAKRKKALLLRFGGLRGVKAASKEELAKVEGISSNIANKIYQHFHS